MAFERKYELTDETLHVSKMVLRRIRAVRDFGDVKAGDLGGWVSSDGAVVGGRTTRRASLDHDGDCWLYGDAKSFAGGRVCGDAKLYDQSEVIGEKGVVGGTAIIRDRVVVDGRQTASFAYGYGGVVVGTTAELTGAGHVTNPRSGFKVEYEPKYELTGETRDHEGLTVHRIRAVRDFGNVQAGDLGGWVEGERNLSHTGEAWIANDAVAAGMSVVRDDAQMRNQAALYDHAILTGSASMEDDAIADDHAKIVDRAWMGGESYATGWTWVTEDSTLSDRVEVRDNTEISGNADLSGNVKVRDSAVVTEDAVLSGNVVVADKAVVGADTRLRGHERIKGEESLTYVQQQEPDEEEEEPDDGPQPW
ncbi:hypothetical protein [Acetobacter malorum]|uniref:hypothetical protein n=1 Tax=Acetobacter malorum TaxID=178901 RepID=UPI000777C807|nr:hypothetical protein [Acetobacter malorum]